MASEAPLRRSGRASHHLEGAETDAQNEYIAVNEKRGDSGHVDSQSSATGSKKHVELQEPFAEEISASLAEAPPVTTTLCGAGYACQVLDAAETDAQNEYIAVDERRRDTGDSGHFSQDFSYRASCASYAEQSPRRAEMASEVMTTLRMASLACQELDYAENDDDDEYIAVASSRRDTGTDTGVPVGVDVVLHVDQGTDFDGDDQGVVIDATGRAAQSRRSSCDLGSRRSSHDLGVPADCHPAPGQTTVTEVEPIYDSALPPTPPVTSAVARIAYEYHEVKLVRAAPHAPWVSLPVDEDAVYGLLGQLEQPYVNPHAAKKPYENLQNPLPAKQPLRSIEPRGPAVVYETLRAADPLYSLPTDERYVRLGNGGSGGRDRRSRPIKADANYENAYDCLGHDKAESPYSSLQTESVRSSVYDDRIVQVDTAMLY